MKVKTKAKTKNLKATKAHYEAQNTMFNNKQKLDRNYEEVSGVSPIRLRHDTDLYGLKDGIGKFNPIMVENINKMPEEDDYEDPDILKKKKAKEMKSPLKSSQKPNMESASKAKSPSAAK